jgi:predicted nucleic acid-binding protein
MTSFTKPYASVLLGMIGIDTNVLIRYLVEDDPKQTELARIFLSRMCTADDPGFINHAVCQPPRRAAAQPLLPGSIGKAPTPLFQVIQSDS